MAVVDLTQGDYTPGNPEHRVVGKTEKRARKHADQKPRPVYTADQIGQLIRFRMGQLAPIVEEYAELVRVEKILSKYAQK